MTEREPPLDPGQMTSAEIAEDLIGTYSSNLGMAAKRAVLLVRALEERANREPSSAPEACPLVTDTPPAPLHLVPPTIEERPALDLPTPDSEDPFGLAALKLAEAAIASARESWAAGRRAGLREAAARLRAKCDEWEAEPRGR
jgi:hypothetical protein